MGPDEHVERTIKDDCFDARKELEGLKVEVIELMDHDVFKSVLPSNKVGEMKANIMLAYRHLEDARMRLGKVVQAYDGGQSVYPR